MPTSTSRLSYSDCFELFDQALADANGIRFPCESYGAARQWQVRLHYARKIDREDNAKDFDPGHVLFGRSQYDELKISCINDPIGGRAWVVLERRGEVAIADLQIQKLSEVEPLTIEYQRAKLIEPPIMKLIEGPADRRD